MITHFEPQFVYALELNRARWTDFNRHCGQCIKQKSHTFDRRTMAFQVPSSGILHVVTDNRDIKSFCENRHGSDPQKGATSVSSKCSSIKKDCKMKTQQTVMKMPKLEPSSDDEEYDQIPGDFMSISHEKVTHFCTMNCHRSDDLKSIKSRRRCQDAFGVLDFTMMFDVGEYINDPDLQFIVDDMAKWTKYLYFAAPVEEEYGAMDQSSDFQDKWAIHRNKREYQLLLANSWRCVGNSIWESTILHSQSRVGNECNSSWSVRAKLLRMWFRNNRADSDWLPSSIGIAHIGNEHIGNGGNQILNDLMDSLHPRFVYVMESEETVVSQLMRDTINSMDDYNEWIESVENSEDDDQGNNNGYPQSAHTKRGLHIPKIHPKPFDMAIDRRDIKSVCNERNGRSVKLEDGMTENTDLLRLKHEKIRYFRSASARYRYRYPSQPLTVMDLLVLHRGDTFDTMEDMIYALDEMAKWTRYLHVSGMVVRNANFVTKMELNAVSTDWQVKSTKWRKVGNGIWESKEVHPTTMISNQLAHDV